MTTSFKIIQVGFHTAALLPPDIILSTFSTPTERFILYMNFARTGLLRSSMKFLLKN
jgi:hypothetical protein